MNKKQSFNAKPSFDSRETSREEQPAKRTRYSKAFIREQVRVEAFHSVQDSYAARGQADRAAKAIKE